MDDSQRKRQTWLVCLGLAAAVLAVYWPVFHYAFVGFDDNVFITGNEKLKEGLSWKGFVWALTTRDVGLWHPLTWISYLVDYEIFALKAGGFHLTNVLLHLANSILLFFLLQRMLGSLWRSALAAALFALHPQHVESVAWISERKDVLSTSFWLLSVWAYVRYAEESAAKTHAAKRFYLASLAMFALGLMAKPMLVTLPFLLLLFDYWPLRRSAPVPRLLAEKAPFIVLSAAVCVVTILGGNQVGMISSVTETPLISRLESVPVSYVRYIGTIFWPVDLAVLYPYVFDWGWWKIAGATALLLFLTAAVLRSGRARPNLAVGWFWFLIMLAPVLGIVQAGPISIADRYTYLSSTGLAVMILWTDRIPARFLAIGGVLAVAACMAASCVQVRYWKNSDTLFRHTLAVTQGNGVIENNLGKLLSAAGRPDEALPHLLRAVEFSPNLPLAHYNLGMVYVAKGKIAEALEQFDIQTRQSPNDPVAQHNFGRVLLDAGLAADALPHLEKAAQLKPESAEYHLTLGNALRQTGHAAEAIGQYEKALRPLPTCVEADTALAWMLSTTPDASLRNGARAVQLALAADQLSGGQDPKIIGVLAAAYAEAKDFPKAIAAAERALNLAEKQNGPLAATLQAQLAAYRASQPARDTPPPSTAR